MPCPIVYAFNINSAIFRHNRITFFSNTPKTITNQVNSLRMVTKIIKTSLNISRNISRIFFSYMIGCPIMANKRQEKKDDLWFQCLYEAQDTGHCQLFAFFINLTLKEGHYVEFATRKFVL